MSDQAPATAPGPAGPGGPLAATLRRLAMTALLVLCAAAALHLLYVAYCAYTNMQRATNVDYTRYVNTLWNTAHGHWFRYGIDGSYLFFHLSFSLAPWAFLFRLTDHPFALAVLQWFWVVAGGLLMAVAARKQRVPPLAVGGLLLFWAGYHFAQSGVAHEFHGVMLYYLLIPWFYLWRDRRLGWLPFCLLLGVREDAGLVLVPIALYLAVRERWRMGYVYAAVALAYVAIAVFALYPAINGHSLFQIRTHELKGALLSDAARPRLAALAWTLLPAVPFLRRGWLPVVVFAGLPLGMALASGYRFQYALAVHYGGTVHICLALGLIEAWRLAAERYPRPWRETLVAAWLCAAVAVSNGIHGYLPGLRFSPVKRQFLSPRPSGEYATWLARHAVPRDGVLAVLPNLAGFAAARSGFIFPQASDHLESKPVLAAADLVFTTVDRIPATVTEALRQGTWGVWFFDDLYVVLKKGHSTDGNRRLLDRLADRSVALAYTRPAVGDNTWTPAWGMVRRWPGNGEAAGPVVVAATAFRDCLAGRYRLLLSYAAEAAATGSAPLRMRIIQHAGGQRREVWSGALPATGGEAPGEYSQEVQVEEPGTLEVVIEAGASPVVLKTLVLSPVADQR